MDRPHDLGGRTGYGAVPVDAARPWTAWWEPYAYALASVAARIAGVDGDTLRHLMEQMPAAEYTRLGSPGRWLWVAERCASEGGLASTAELADRARRRAAGRGTAEATAEGASAVEYPEPVRTLADRHGGPAASHNKRDPAGLDPPRFGVGHTVRTRDQPTAGHTRLPSYLAGRRGVVALVNGFWVFPDSHANGGPEAPTWVYAVRFEAQDLWPDAEPHHVCADLFEPYLEPHPEP